VLGWLVLLVASALGMAWLTLGMTPWPLHRKFALGVVAMVVGLGFVAALW
jgi:hypothetical protein